MRFRIIRLKKPGSLNRAFCIWIISTIARDLPGISRFDFVNQYGFFFGSRSTRKFHSNKCFRKNSFLPSVTFFKFLNIIENLIIVTVLKTSEIGSISVSFNRTTKNVGINSYYTIEKQQKITTKISIFDSECFFHRWWTRIIPFLIDNCKPRCGIRWQNMFSTHKCSAIEIVTLLSISSFTHINDETENFSIDELLIE